MSKSDTANRPIDREESPSPEWCCHHCDRQFATPAQAGQAHALLVEHIVGECQSVPPSVRARYTRSCPGGNCDV